jgi:hypothetical protein
MKHSTISRQITHTKIQIKSPVSSQQRRMRKEQHDKWIFHTRKAAYGIPMFRRREGHEKAY